MIGRTNALTIISAGGGGVLNPWDDVCFYDVDGTLYKTMTKEEFAELDSLPALPDHTDDGLYADGWYWSPFERQNQTLATFKAYLADVGYLDLAAEYTCSDSKIEIELTDVLTIYLHLNFTITTANAVTLNVDWGDGTSDSYASGSQQTKHFSHTYPSAGKYTIGLSGEVTSSSGGFYNVQLNYLPTAYSSSSSSSGLNGTDIVKKVIIGDSFPNKSISNCHFTFIKAKDFKYFYSTLRTTSSSAYRSMIGQFVGQFDHHVCFRELCFRPVNATTNAPYTSTLIKETKPVMS